jgi:hypothetical protein
MRRATSMIAPRYARLYTPFRNTGFTWRLAQYQVNRYRIRIGTTATWGRPPRTLFARMFTNDLTDYRADVRASVVTSMRDWPSYQLAPTEGGTSGGQGTSGGDHPWGSVPIIWPAGVAKEAQDNLMDTLRTRDPGKQRTVVADIMNWAQRYYPGSLGAEIADQFKKALALFGDALSGTIAHRFLLDLPLICAPPSAANLVKLVIGETKHWLDEPWYSASGWAGSALDADGRLWLYASGLGMDRMAVLGFGRSTFPDGSSCWVHPDIPNLHVILKVA